MSEDKRLDRLLDYTKFHIGIYLSAGGGMVALLASAANAGKTDFLKTLVASPTALAVAAAFMVVAGLAGGVIASSCTQCTTFKELWEGRQGPHTLKIFTGQYWAFVEHTAFWLSFAFAAYSVLASSGVKTWLAS